MPYDPQTLAISPKRLLILREVERAGSIRRAAKTLYLSEPAIRDNLSVLEEAVGGVLKRVEEGDPPGLYRLSELGEEVLRHGKDVIERCEAITQLSTSRAPAVAFLPHHAPLLAKVAETHASPTRLMHMQVLGESERSEVAYQERVLARLAAGGIEVAVGHPAVLKTLQSKPLYRTSYRAMLPKGKHGKTITLAELAELDLLLPPAPTRSRSLLDKRFEREGLVVHVALEAFQTKVLILMGWAGIGTVVLPADLARLYDAGQPFGGDKAAHFDWVKVIDSDGEPLNHKVNVTTRGAEAAPGVDAIVEALRSAARALRYDTKDLEAL